MQRALSTHLFVNQRLTTDVLQQIEDARIPAVEIFCAKQHLDYTDAVQVRELARWFASHSLQPRSLHTPLFRDYEWGHSGSRALVNLAEPERIRRQESVDEIKRALELAESIPFRYAVQHLGVPGESFSQAKFDAAHAALEPLLVFARQRGVELLLENLPNELSTPQRLREFIDYTRLRNLRICFDIGHAHLGEGVEKAFAALRDLVVSTHLHDNNGEKDDHFFPFQGGIAWDAALRALTASTLDFPFQLEVRDYGEFSRPLEKALETFRRLEELALAPQE